MADRRLFVRLRAQVTAPPRVDLTRADRARIAADRVIHAPHNAWDWLTDPVNPERVGEAVVVVLLLGAAYTGSVLGFALASFYLTGWMVTEQVPRWRKRRRERKQAKVAAAKAAAEAQIKPPSSFTSVGGSGL